MIEKSFLEIFAVNVNECHNHSSQGCHEPRCQALCSEMQRCFTTAARAASCFEHCRAPAGAPWWKRPVLKAGAAGLDANCPRLQVTAVYIDEWS